jgi:Leucine-rich repeat (LRR) protein
VKKENGNLEITPWRIRTFMSDLIKINKLKNLCDFSYTIKDNRCESISFYDPNYIFENTIRKNSLKEDIVKTISELPYLRHVNLRKSRINYFPNFASNDIEYLDISCNNISKIDEKKINFPKLKFLNLGSNNLTKLPDMSHLPLETLKLHKNQIKELPKISKKIKNLNLFINNIKQIPKLLFELLELEIFSFGMTKIKKIPDFSIFKNIKWLNLPCNEIKSIPKTLCNCENLEGLILAKNKINKISDDIGKLKNLHTISLYKNFINKLPESFYNLNLNKFCIEENPIAEKMKNEK